MSGVFGSTLKTGCWTISSKSDPRWDDSGEGVVGGLTLPYEALDYVEAKKKELGEEPPDDLEYSYMKD